MYVVFTKWIFKKEFLSILGLELIGNRIKVQSASERKSSDEFRASDESVCRRIGIVSTREITIVRCDDRVLITLLDVFTIPLTDAGPASVRQHGASKFSKNFGLN